jgi:Icc-related predicted phosphoesterase
MNLQLYSDLHLEFMSDKGAAWLDKQQPKANTLVLAGDIMSATKIWMLDLVFNNVSHKWKNVLFTPGNHEFYFTSLQDGWKLIREVAARYSNIHLLDNNEIELEGVKFYGGTGWYPESRYPDRRQLISDFSLIKGIEPDVYLSRYAFKKQIQHCSPDVVISHHLPTEECVHPKYKGSPLNDYFVSNFDVESVAPKLWLFGHTHFSMDFKIGDTRLVSNPKGYPRDRESSFNSDLVLEV